MTEVLHYVEIDIDYCSLNYGIAPCTASLGVTGDDKCFNSLSTCQDLPNFDNVPVTLRFGMDTDFLPPEHEVLPALVSVQYSPAKISVAENLGERASLTAVFRDFRHSDAGDGFDKYFSERAYDPYNQGTFWGKFRARQLYMRGRALRLLTGKVGDALADMETRHYIIDSFDYDHGGRYKIVAKDILKLADGDRAQAPAPSTGELLGAITDSDTSATLTPSGIGDIEYPASGHIAIGGEEIVSFTRSGDVLTITRGQLGTPATAHSAEERMQLVLRYNAQDPADIIYDLFTTYAGVPTAYIELSDWQAESANFIGRLYTGIIAEPTSVNALISELIEQVGLIIFWDDLNQLIRFQALRSVSVDNATFSHDNVIEGSISTKEQPNRRITRVLTYYNQRNPLNPLDELDNYGSALLSVDTDIEALYGSFILKKITSRWIPEGGQVIASDLNNRVLARFKEAPRSIKFDMVRFGPAPIDPEPGIGYRFSAWNIQDEFGAEVAIPVQAVSVKQLPDRYKIEAEEFLFDLDQADIDLTQRAIVFDTNTFNVNLKDVHDALYPAITDNESPSIFINVSILAGVKIGSTSPASPAFDVGTWPAGVTITITSAGKIMGRGGTGGNYPNNPGQAGGTSLYTRQAIIYDNTDGSIVAPGGGGSGSNFVVSRYGGGGGAGILGGVPGGGPDGSGSPGTETAGGDGIPGSGPTGVTTGGGPALPGVGLLGGVAGIAIDGDSFITFTDEGTITGTRTN